MKLALFGGKAIRKKPFPLYPSYGEEERKAVMRVMDSNALCSMVGEEVKNFEEEYAQYHNIKHAIGVSSGTTALHTAYACAGIGVGDEIIVPDYTFFGTATSVLMQNSIPVFADIEPQTLGIDPNSIEKNITNKTKAIVVVHMNGFPADMKGILAVAKKHDLIVIEDCSHAHGAEYEGKKVGTIGDIGIFSFQHKKNLSVGEGGIVITNDSEVAKKARHFISFGPSVPLNYNYRMTELHGAIGSVRLKRLDSEIDQRLIYARFLDEKLSQFEGLNTLTARKNTKPVYYSYIIQYSEDYYGVKRDKIVQALQAEGLPALAYYTPVHRHETFQIEDPYGKGCPFTCPYYLKEGEKRQEYKDGICPVTENLCDTTNIELKIHPPADKSDMQDVVSAFEKIFNNINELKADNK